ncbi:MAG TPA: hypothetical protein VIK62_08345 [Verrucomicrobiae bacterium]
MKFNVEINWETIVTIIIALISGMWALWERKNRRKAELQLRDTVRRGEAPFLVVSDKAFNGLYVAAEKGQGQFWPPGDKTLLCWMRDEVDRKTGEGETVILVVENLGKAARRVSIKLDGKTISLDKEMEMEGANDLPFFRYAYSPVLHGKEQKLTIEFETSAGIQDKHIYLTKHGCRILKRIDPA